MTPLPRPLSARDTSLLLRSLFAGLIFVIAPLVVAAASNFHVAAQSTSDALLAFSKQSGIEVLFSYDELRLTHSQEVIGMLEPEQALSRLLQGTGYSARRSNQGKFVISASRQQAGAMEGQLISGTGAPIAGVRINLPDAGQATTSDAQGKFKFSNLTPGIYQLFATDSHYRTLQITQITITAGNQLTLTPQVMQRAADPTRLDPYIVESESARMRPVERGSSSLTERVAIGNLDLPRTENDALPYKILQRDQILRSGVVDLNEFLQRQLLDSDASTRPPEQSGNQSTFISGSSNLNLRGFGSDGTVILVNGRRMPETISDSTGVLGSPDVNFIPLGLVQQVEVLPVSASALYSGNPVGGVINIVLRPDITGSEVTTTYTNAIGHYDAPQTSVSLQHGESLLKGKLQVRLNATFTHTTPPVENELGYRTAHLPVASSISTPLYRATPNIRSADGSALFGPGTSSVTSVAPGATNSNEIAPFLARQGLRSLGLFDSPAGMAASPESSDYPYGRKQDRETYFGSVIYDIFPWLQLGVDGIYTRNRISRGLDVFTADLELDAASPFNPFGQTVNVSLNETAPLLGENYSEARLEFASVVFGALVKLPADWRVSTDVQYGRNVSKYRGLAGVDAQRWQHLVDEGRYNPLRDTQVHAPPASFYDEALLYYGKKGRFVTLGDYDTLDTAMRVTNQSLVLPTGRSSFSFGGDYRRNHLASYTQRLTYADGALFEEPQRWSGRTLERMSAFTELQASLVPRSWLPGWIENIETDLAVRYVQSDLAREANTAPIYSLKIDFAGGFSLRGSITDSKRFPTPRMSRPVGDTGPGGPGSNTIEIADPLRNGERYIITANEELNPNLVSEAAATQTAGLLFRKGQIHRFRAGLDFYDTRKLNELQPLGAQEIINLGDAYADRITRRPLTPGDPFNNGRIASVLTGTVNASWRHSQSWNLSLDYAWTECFGGTLETYARLVYLQSYDRQLFPNSPVVDELNHPQLSTAGLLKYRTNFGAGWNNRDVGFGFDGQYFHSRTLPVIEWAGQGSQHIKPYTQIDLYLQHDLTRWLPWNPARYGLRAQLRVNNFLGFDYPKYVNDPSGAGVQPYGDWRKRTYSFSLTATF